MGYGSLALSIVGVGRPYYFLGRCPTIPSNYMKEGSILHMPKLLPRPYGLYGLNAILHRNARGP